MHNTLKRFLAHFPDARRVHERIWTSDTMLGSVDFSVGQFYISVYLNDFDDHGRELSVFIHGYTDSSEVDWESFSRVDLPEERHELLAELVRKIMEEL